jgi:hypothetical protein
MFLPTLTFQHVLAGGYGIQCLIIPLIIKDSRRSKQALSEKQKIK